MEQALKLIFYRILSNLVINLVIKALIFFKTV